MHRDLARATAQPLPRYDTAKAAQLADTADRIRLSHLGTAAAAVPGPAATAPKKTAQVRHGMHRHERWTPSGP
jgi:hypothetical protein